MEIAWYDLVVPYSSDDIHNVIKLIAPPGYISLLDPPRDDTEETINQAQAHGVEVKMITGDQRAIAIETARRLGMGTNIFGIEVRVCNGAITFPNARLKCVASLM